MAILSGFGAVYSPYTYLMTYLHPINAALIHNAEKRLMVALERLAVKKKQWAWIARTKPTAIADAVKPPGVAKRVVNYFGHLLGFHYDDGMFTSVYEYGFSYGFFCFCAEVIVLRQEIVALEEASKHLFLEVHNLNTEMVPESPSFSAVN